jgi:hypothetical protein
MKTNLKRPFITYMFGTAVSAFFVMQNIGDASQSSLPTYWEMFSWKEVDGNWHYSLCSAAKSSSYRKKEVLESRRLAVDLHSLEALLISLHVGNLIWRTDDDLQLVDRTKQPVFIIPPEAIVQDVTKMCDRLKTTLVLPRTPHKPSGNSRGRKTGND